jgi:hypothetical protein
MLNTLVDGKNREVARTRQASVIEHCRKIAQHLRPPIGPRNHTVDKVGAWQVQHFFWNGFTLVAKKRFGFVAENLLDVFYHIASGCRSRGENCRNDVAGNFPGPNILSGAESEVNQDRNNEVG